MKRVLLLGASGIVAPHIIPCLEPYYELCLADVKPHPEGKPTLTVDVTSYEQVLEAARGVEAIMNFTVNRQDPTLSFAVNTQGALHVAKAAVELGIKKIVHTGPALVLSDYTHDFDIGDVPQRPGTSYYWLTKYLSLEICKIYARTHGIQIVCFQLVQLRPKPTERAVGDSCAFIVVWEDLAHACRLALEIESVPDHFQAFNLHSFGLQGKYLIEKAERILGYWPLEQVEDCFKRRT